MNALHKTHIVSFPRCGQHMIVRGLMWVMPDLVHYSEWYAGSELTIENDDHINVQKEHDFNLDLEINPHHRYIVVMRDMWNAMISWWDLAVHSGTPDTEEAFEEFMVGKVDYYHKFHDKWHRQNNPKIMNLYYEVFVNDPARKLKEICDFVQRDIPQSLLYSNTRELAYKTFAVACWMWAAEPKSVFKHEKALSKHVPI